MVAFPLPIPSMYGIFTYMLVDLPYMDAMGYISLTNTASIAEDKPSILGGTKHQRHVNGDQL